MKNNISMTKSTTKDMISKSIMTIIILILFSQTAYSMQMTEILFNPEGTDTGREWIEVTLDESEGCLNLTEFRLFEGNTNHNIYSMDEEIFCSHAIICNDLDKFLQEYPYMNLTQEERQMIVVYKSSFSLSNSGEELALKKGSEILEYLNYSTLLEYITVEEGYSLELMDDTWRRSASLGGSPVERSIVEADISVNMSINTSINNTIDSTSNITINVTINNTVIDNTSDSSDDYTINTSDSDTGNPSYNETQQQDDGDDGQQNEENQTYQNHTTDTYTEENMEENGNFTGCYVSLDIRLKNDSLTMPYINLNGAQIKFYNKLEFKDNISTKNYSIEYWIEDITGNMLKSRMITNNQDEKSFTPNIDETDRIIFIKGVIKDIACNITKGADEQAVLVQNRGYSAKACPECECKAIKCSPCTSKTDKSSYITEDACQELCSKKSSQAPSIKIVNVCNNSEDMTANKTANNNETTGYDMTRTQSQENSQSGIMTNQALSDNNSKKSIDKGLTTGMIIYESPNIKNRFYAIVGFILVGLSLIVISAYKFIGKRYMHRKGISTEKIKL